jgi:hypothetical protein
VSVKALARLCLVITFSSAVGVSSGNRAASGVLGVKMGELAGAECRMWTMLEGGEEEEEEEAAAR